MIIIIIKIRALKDYVMLKNIITVIKLLLILKCHLLGFKLVFFRGIVLISLVKIFFFFLILQIKSSFSEAISRLKGKY